eukprot:CAMPEP_0184195512 /NCGR_PEP_ID=MMETSP0976-20121227/5035_1 /TAXON_ID=483370 /ORGANISM="non described non described, Strain CCMP2097" /LENGTH=50 /DNA_ID=CAMNT_0026499953 /DNA_START=277 /DNA_END=426 /DNA_ORIENTATION=-
MNCASALPLSTCFCTRRSHSAADLLVGVRQSGQRVSCCRHLTEQSVQMLL